MESGLAHVASFPPTVQCYELVLECAKHYDKGTQRVIGPQGKIMANFSPPSMAQTFDIPDRSHVVAFDLDMAKNYYEDDTKKALR